MKKAALTVLPLVLGGCIAVSADSDNTVTNEQGNTVSATTLTLNGMWEGEFDQTTSLRLMVYQGTVYAIDDSSGFYGSVVLDSSDNSMSMTLAAMTISASDAAAGWYYASGSAIAYSLSGLLFSASSSNDTLVGDYDATSVTGSYVLTNDGTWNDAATLNKVAGQWVAGDYELYISLVGGTASLKGIAGTTGGCSFSGTLAIIDSGTNLYSVNLTERKNCDVFNKTNVQGYATINTDGALEFYLRKDSELFFMTYTAAP